MATVDRGMQLCKDFFLAISKVDEEYATTQIHLQEYVRRIRGLQFIFCSHVIGTPLVFLCFPLITDVLLFSNMLIARAMESNLPFAVASTYMSNMILDAINRQ